MKAARWRSRDRNAGGHQSCSVSVSAAVIGGWSPPGLVVGEEIGYGHWFVARWAKPTRTDAAAEAPAVRAILLTEQARLTRWAFINGAWPRGPWWGRRRRSRVT